MSRLSKKTLIRIPAAGIILCIMMHFCLCRQQEETVAEFGPHRLSLEEFRAAYLNVIKQPQSFDSPEQREQFLQELINRRLLAAAAESTSLASDEKLHARIEAYGDKILRDLHFQKVIQPRIEVSPEEVEKVFRFSRERRHIRHLFAGTRMQADSLRMLLESGVPFEKLAGTVYAGSVMEGSEGNLGWVSWDQMEYDMAMTAFSLKAGEISRPVPSVHGYHIIQVLDYEKNPLLSRNDLEMHRITTKNLVRQRKGEKEANLYVHELMSQRQISINPRILEFVGGCLEERLTRSPADTDRMNEIQLTEPEIQALESDLWQRRKETLAEIDGEVLTIGDFLGHLNFVPYAAAAASLKTALDYVLRDFVLTLEAEDMDLDRSPVYKLRRRLYGEYVMQLALRRRLVREAEVSNAEIRARYEESETYSRAPFDDIRPLIRKELLAEKKMSSVTGTIRRLRQENPVRTYPDIIHGYYSRFQQNEQSEKNPIQ